MPVQRVCRPNQDFRGFQGEVASGTIRVGNQVTILPSGEKAHVQKILKGMDEVETASCGQPVTISLDREIDLARGDVITESGQKSGPEIGRLFKVMLLWMDESRLLAGKNYLMKLGTARVPATVMKIRSGIDVNTGKHIYADAIYKNEIAICEISVSIPVAASSFEDNPNLGSFILIDRVSHMTAACGTISRKLERSDHLTWQQMDISPDQRAGQKGQHPMTIWLTGLSGSGKSTLANAMEKKLFLQGRHTMILDGDNIRMGLNHDLGFKEGDRIENIRRVAEVARLMNDAGLIVFVCLVSPYTRDRRRAREIIGEDRFIEVYVSTPLAECERRDVKGLYRKARNKEISHFTGISAPYEIPANPDYIVDGSETDPEQAAGELLNKLADFI